MFHAKVTTSGRDKIIFRTEVVNIMLFPSSKICFVRNILNNAKDEIANTIVVICTLQIEITMLVCFQSSKMLSLALKKIHRRANIEMLRSLIDYRVYTRLVRNSSMFKVRPPVLLFLRSWIYMKNNINRLIAESIEIEGALSRLFGGTVMHDRRFFSIIMPRGARWIAEARLCCIPLLCSGSASIAETMRKGTIAEVAL